MPSEQPNKTPTQQQIESLLRLMEAEETKGCTNFRVALLNPLSVEGTLDLVQALTAAGVTDVNLTLPTSDLPGDYVQIEWRKARHSQPNSWPIENPLATPAGRHQGV